jgi:hypothetical protein
LNATCSSETSVLRRTTRSHIPRDDTLYSHWRGNFNFYKVSN